MVGSRSVEPTRTSERLSRSGYAHGPRGVEHGRTSVALGSKLLKPGYKQPGAAPDTGSMYVRPDWPIWSGDGESGPVVRSPRVDDRGAREGPSRTRGRRGARRGTAEPIDRKSTRLNSSHVASSYAVF